MNFGEAIAALKTGKRVRRDGWNGKRMRLMLVTKSEFSSTDSDGYQTSAASPGGVPPFIAMHTVQNTLVPWVASQTDMLAEDWVTL